MGLVVVPGHLRVLRNPPCRLQAAPGVSAEHQFTSRLDLQTRHPPPVSGHPRGFDSLFGTQIPPADGGVITAGYQHSPARGEPRNHQLPIAIQLEQFARLRHFPVSRLRLCCCAHHLSSPARPGSTQQLVHLVHVIVGNGQRLSSIHVLGPHRIEPDGRIPGMEHVADVVGSGLHVGSIR